MRAELAVSPGSGGGFVPRLMRQAQRDAGIADRSRTILVDDNVPDVGWGSPQWLDPDSFFRKHYPDVELVLEKTAVAAERVFAAEGLRIDYLHIDADHSPQGCLDDFTNYRPFLHVGSLVTLRDTNLPGAGVTYVLEYLRARSDCEVLDIVEAGTGTAVVRITCELDPAVAGPIPPDVSAPVEIAQCRDSPLLEPPTVQWRYLHSEAFSLRNVLAAHIVRDCPTVIEIGGCHTPIDRYLAGTHKSVLVIDPFIRDATRDSLNGTPCQVRHVRARFQDLVWTVRREREYGLVILGLDLEGLSAADQETLFSLVRGARTTVVEFASSWDPSGRMYAAILAGAGVEELQRVRLDLGATTSATSPTAGRRASSASFTCSDIGTTSPSRPSRRARAATRHIGIDSSPATKPSPRVGGDTVASGAFATMLCTSLTVATNGFRSDGTLDWRGSAWGRTSLSS
jgi:hypothetical protein